MTVVPLAAEALHRNGSGGAGDRFLAPSPFGIAVQIDFGRVRLSKIVVLQKEKHDLSIFLRITGINNSSVYFFISKFDLLTEHKIKNPSFY